MANHVFLLHLASALAAQDPPVTLVIDDLHLLTDPGVLKELDFVLRNAGPGLRLVACSRTDPLLPLHRSVFVGGAFGSSRILAGQTAPEGRQRTGHLVVIARNVTTTVVVTAMLGVLLLCLARVGRWVLDRRRLAAWGAAWAAVGPLWTKRFRSRG